MTGLKLSHFCICVDLEGHGEGSASFFETMQKANLISPQCCSLEMSTLVMKSSEQISEF